MNTPAPSSLPCWIAPFCCVAPYCALIGFSLSGLLGGQVSTPGLISLVFLCGKVTEWVLRNPVKASSVVRIEAEQSIDSG